MKKIVVKLLKNENIIIPKYMSQLAAGLDIHADLQEDIIIKSGERAIVPTGIKVAIPQGYELEIRPRSGLAINHGITVINSPGTIDADYRGEIKIGLINHSKDDYTIKSKDRIAQMLLKKVYTIEFEEVNELEDTTRGVGGFGHTGKG